MGGKKLKHIGIITLNGYENYGNRLQNYALQEVIKSMNCTVDTVIIQNDEKKMPKKNIKKFLKVNPQILLSKANNKRKSYMMKIINKNIIQERRNRFKDFSNERIVETGIEISNKEMIKKYSYFVVGSDQVWNPHYIKNSPDNFLEFAPLNKRIAYAPSFGASSIPNEYKENYKIGLEGFKDLSVREDIGAKIIKDLTGKKAKIVLDPTMLLTKEEWLSIAKEVSNKPKQSYLLTYFLGDIESETKKVIKKIANDNNLIVVNLAQIKSKEWYTVDPAEFIDLINSSALFCTDSFHGAVFSILLERSFIVFDRSKKTYSMNSRIETLLNKFSLESRLSNNIKYSDDVFQMDFSHVSKVLKKEKEESLSFLKNVIS